MWKVVYIAPTAEIAERIKTLLTENGFLIQVNINGNKPRGNSGVYEISVPVSEAEEAFEVLCENKFQG